MKKFLIFIVLIVTLGTTRVIYADTKSFDDDYEHSFEYDSSWSYSKEEYNDGYNTYVFANRNGEILQLAFTQLDQSVTKADMEYLCKESDGEYVYLNDFSRNGITWYVLEYKEAVRSYYGSVDNVLYRINIPSADNDAAYKLTMNIVSGVSATSKSSSSSNNSSNRVSETISQTALIIDAGLSIVGLIAVIYLNKKRKDKQRVIVCENCGAENTGDSLYCTKCGMKLNKEKR